MGTIVVYQAMFTHVYAGKEQGMKGFRIKRAILSVVLAAILVVLQPGDMLFATEINPTQDTVALTDDGLTADQALQDDVGYEEDDAVDTGSNYEGEAGYEGITEEETVSGNAAKDAVEVAEKIFDPEDTLSGNVLMRPTDAQQKAADELKEELEKFKRGPAGEDYIENEAMFLAESEEEAVKIAGEYGATLLSFANGVATVAFNKDGNTEQVFTEITESVDAINEAVEVLEKKGEGLAGNALSLDVLDDVSSGLADELKNIDVEGLPDTPIYANILYHIDTVTPDDEPLYNSSNETPRGQWFLKSIRAKEAWDTGADGSGVKVAVIDSGLDTSNNDINATCLTTSGYTSGKDENGHGTHCVGIIGARDNGIGGLGVAPNATMVSIRAGDRKGGLRTSDIVEAINIAINNNVDIISMSFGSTESSTPEKDALKKAMDQGILCLSSAGNEASNKKTYPASYDGVMAIASYAPNGELSSFSNYGSWVDLAGPGSFILAPMVDANGYQRMMGWFSDMQTSGCSYGKLSGTSMSCPAVAGVAALVKSKHPTYTADQIKAALINSAPDATYSYNGHTQKGGIDALKAVNYSAAGGGGEEKKEDNDFLFNGTGPGIKVKQGKSVALRPYTSLNTKVNKITYRSEDTSIATVSGTGTVKVNKKAPVGSTVRVTTSCGAYNYTTLVTVVAADYETPKFKLSAAPYDVLSTVEDAANHSTIVYVNGADTDVGYYTTITGKGGARYNNRGVTVGYNYSREETRSFPVTGLRAGKVTVTVYATDGSNYKQSINLNVVSPLESVDITYAGAPIRGAHIQMAKGASLTLKGVARGAGDSVYTGKVKYTWSGQYINKSGKVTIPKGGADFNVTLTAEDSDGNTATRTLRIWGGKNSKIALMGYVMQTDSGNIFYTSVRSNGDIDGDPYAVGGCYGYSDMNMPDLSNWRFEYKKKWYKLNGPYGFVSKSPKDMAWDYGTNNGQYVLNVSGPSIIQYIYGDYGVRGYVPGKKGSYKVIFTALDGSGKTFTVPFNVTSDQVGNSISVEDVIKSPGF